MGADISAEQAFHNVK